MMTTKLAVSLPLSILIWASSVNADPTTQHTQVEPDGSYTFTQKIDYQSNPPHYFPPTGYGFNEYSWFNEDYGWQHNFDLFNDPDIQIINASLMIRGWDVDSEPHRGTRGEYDGISIDNQILDPGLLQGKNQTWSETTFDIPIHTIMDDGLINVFMDIDMNHNRKRWATTLDHSLLSINYIIMANDPPYQPEVNYQPMQAVTSDDDLVVTPIGPMPADPDGNHVTYTYRWFVDVGQGYFVDDNFAGKDDHTGARVPSSQTQKGERWRCTITPIDSNGVMGTTTTITWGTIGDADEDGVFDELDQFPLDASRAFINRTPTNGYYTLAYEDLWPQQGDFDLNDLVARYAFTLVSDSNNHVKDIQMETLLVSRGADRANGFAISFNGTDSDNFESGSLNLDGMTSLLEPEQGHQGELVMILVENLNQIMPGNEQYSFYNTNKGDSRPAKTLNLALTFKQAVSTMSLGGVPFNPFIFATFDRGTEVHLPHRKPTDLANLALLGTGDDASNPTYSWYYITDRNLPWALNITSSWLHPYENVDIGVAYPQIKEWAESSGFISQTWYRTPITQHCWQNN